MTVFVLVGYDDFEGGTLLGVYSDAEAAERAKAEVTTRFDDLAVHSVAVGAPPRYRSILEFDEN